MNTWEGGNMNIEQLVNRVRHRPAMFIGCFSLEPMYHFINGFLYNNLMSERADYVDMAFKYRFHDWVRVQLEKKHNIELEKNGNYLIYISEVYQDLEQSMKVFFEFCDEFFNEVHNEEYKI